MHERIPLPKPTREFIKLFEKAKELSSTRAEFYNNESEQEESNSSNEEEEEESEDESEEKEPEKPKQVETQRESRNQPIEKTQSESESNAESSLIPCPNCKRTFFSERLAVHQKMCKPGKPMKKPQTKRKAYQPPKLKAKKTWKPPSEGADSEPEQVNFIFQFA